jgi:signal transduction histidine kinase
MASHASPRRGAFRIALGACLLVCGGLLLMRATGRWLGDAIVWPAAAGAFGALLIWRAPRPTPGRRRSWAAHTTPQALQPLQQAARVRTPGRLQVSTRGLGVALVLAAGLANLWASGEVRPAGEAVLAGITVLIAAALIFAPSWRRLAAGLQAEKDERIRSQERADVGAHLHDSVLQTLALIQRSADDPTQVSALARRQERELRSWLAGETAHPADEELGAALRRAASEVEAAAGGSLEVVVVGERPLEERGEAVLAAAREAMLNAAKFAPQEPISVYAELSGESAQVYVRDRGEGFDPAEVPAERRGVRESIIGRMRRVGGRAAVRSSPGGGTEIEIAIGPGSAE